MKKSNSFLPLLDVISCALGAGVLLAVIFSIIEVPIPAPMSDDFIAVEVWSDDSRHVWGVVARHEELNLTKIIAPDQTVLRDLNQADLPPEIKGAAKYDSWQGIGGIEYASESNIHTVSTFLITEPIEGTWFLVPFLYDMAEQFDTGEQDSKVKFRWKTKNVTVENDCGCRTITGLMPGQACPSSQTEIMSDPYNFEEKKCKGGVTYIRVEI